MCFPFSFSQRILNTNRENLLYISLTVVCDSVTNFVVIEEISDSDFHTLVKLVDCKVISLDFK